MFNKPKLKVSGFGVRKGLLMEKGKTKKMGDFAMPQRHLAHWSKLRVLKGVGEQLCESTGRTLSCFCKNNSH